jgi:hypothetical protein
MDGHAASMQRPTASIIAESGLMAVPLFGMAVVIPAIAGRERVRIKGLFLSVVEEEEEPGLTDLRSLRRVWLTLCR